MLLPTQVAAISRIAKNLARMPAVFSSSLLKEGVAISSFSKAIASFCNMVMSLPMNDACSGLSIDQLLKVLGFPDNDPAHTAVQGSKRVIEFGYHAGEYLVLCFQMLVVSRADLGDHG